MIENNFIENELVILTKQTVDVLLKQDNPMDLIALYTFYYYTAKWQKTNRIKCTTGYVAKGLKCSEAKIRKAKKQLIELGVIEDAVVKDSSNKITGHYIKMNYVFKKETVEKYISNSSHPIENSQCGSHPIENPQGGNVQSVEKQETNALSSNSLNALSSNSLNALSNSNCNAEKYKTIISYLNEKAGTNYMPKSKDTQQHINARLSEGFSIEDFKIVIDKKCAEWIGTEWEKFLRPKTLFGTKFESYLNQRSTSNKTVGVNGIEIAQQSEPDILDDILK